MTYRLVTCLLILSTLYACEPPNNPKYFEGDLPLAVTPQQLSFSGLEEGDTEAQLTLTLRNIQGENLTLTGWSLVEDDATTELSIVDAEPWTMEEITLEADEEVSMTVAWRPIDNEEDYGRLIFTWNDGSLEVAISTENSDELIIGGAEAGIEAGEEAGEEAGIEAGEEAGEEAGIEAGDEAGSEAGTPAGEDAGTEAGMESGTPAGADAGTEAGTEAGEDAGTEAGVESGTQAGAEAGAESGAEAGAESGTEAGENAGTEAGAESGTEAGEDAGEGAGTEAGTPAGDQIGGAPVDDADGDGIIDVDDNCVNLSNPEQRDRDRDGQGDLCDTKPDDFDGQVTGQSVLIGTGTSINANYQVSSEVMLSVGTSSSPDFTVISVITH